MTFLDATKLVFVAGSGPAVIVMTEMPCISPEVARFARFVRDAGFTVFMPSLFGDPGRAPSVVTHHVIDRAGEPTRAAVDEILGFFAERLRGDGGGGRPAASGGR
jgi:dienelactone hydrolase